MIKAQQQSLADQYKENRVVFIAVFLTIYIAPHFSLPIITLLTLLTGAIFDLVLASLWLSFATKNNLPFWCRDFWRTTGGQGHSGVT